MRTLLLAAARKRKPNTGPLDPDVINFGDENLGYYGEVPAADLITMSDLIASVGVVEGQTQNLDTDWLKFAHEGKTLYVAKKAIVNNISYEALAARGLNNGGATRDIGGKTYKVRLLKGVTEDPGFIPGGEWDALIHRVQVGGGEPRWGEYSAAELCVGLDSVGGLSLCQERYSADVSWVARGYPDPIQGVWYIFDNLPNSGYGWRPVLELVE